MVAPTDLATAVLLVGMALAGAFDFASREVPDNLWRILGVVGAALGLLSLTEPGALLPAVLWIVVAAYAIQHFFPWTERLGPLSDRAVDAVDAFLAIVVVLIVGVPTALLGIGPTTVPYAVIATLAVSLVARGLYEVRLLTGGADAKALIVMGVVLPVLPVSLVFSGPASVAFLTVVPFALTALVDAALLSLVVPLAIAVRNLRRRTFRWRDGLTTYEIPLEQLPKRFVWVEEAGVATPSAERHAETSEEDRARRQAQFLLLRDQGRTIVRVSPQLPFVLFLALGSVAAILVGNLLFDLVTVL